MTKSTRKVNGALVLGAASAMVAIGVVALTNTGDEPAPVAPPSIQRALIDQSTPERAAESFLDAWRKRDHESALELTEGEAHEAVLARQARDMRLTEHERELKAQVWDAMAQNRLRLMIDEAEELEGNRLRITGTAEGDFLGSPYVRQVEMITRAHPGGMNVVEAFAFGEILSELPGELHLED